jgi:hypothetical protein
MYTKLFNRIIILTFIGTIIYTANSLSQLAGATLPATVMPASSETLQALEEVRKEEIRSKLMLNEKPALTNADITQTTNPNWIFYGERALAISAGAVVGATAFNFITSGTIISPQTMTAVGVGAPIVSVTSNAFSIYAIASAAVGGLAGDFLFMAMQPQESSK